MSLHKSNIVRNGGHSYLSCMITITNYNMVTFDRSLLERAHEIALSSLFLEIRFLPPLVYQKPSKLRVGKKKKNRIALMIRFDSVFKTKNSIDLYEKN